MFPVDFHSVVESACVKLLRDGFSIAQDGCRCVEMVFHLTAIHICRSRTDNIG